MTTIVVGLGYGDEGKGTIVDYLSSLLSNKNHVIGRFSGGAQALHHVYTADERSHGFRLHSSGTLNFASTELNKGVIVDPQVSLDEMRKLAKLGITRPGKLLSVHRNCLVATPWHRGLGKHRETQRTDKVSTCGMGIGEVIRQKETWCWNLRAKDLLRPLSEIEELLERIVVRTEDDGFDIGYRPPTHAVHRIAHEFKTWAEEVDIRDLDWQIKGPDIIEGSQGLLISPEVGEWPFVTKTSVTAASAKATLPFHHFKKSLTIGVIRAFMTRHGYGPFNPDSWEGKTPKKWTDGEDNKTNTWQSKFRYGPLDLQILKETVPNHGKIDGLAITCLDRVKYPHPVHVNNEIRKVKSEEEFLDLVETELGIPILIKSYGKTYKDKHASNENELV